MLTHSEGFCFHEAQSIIHDYTSHQSKEIGQHLQSMQQILTPTTIILIWTQSCISLSLLYCWVCSLSLPNERTLVYNFYIYVHEPVCWFNTFSKGNSYVHHSSIWSQESYTVLCLSLFTSLLFAQHQRGLSSESSGISSTNTCSNMLLQQEDLRSQRPSPSLSPGR